ncbi:hypothetical protein [Vitreimonas flagellata]|uniref:DoxX family protein n=1 Tax=Vitreimonas flagellata TaxID=2560861 RepID=UPI001074E208|nr:hypothetical protein [Vitreimonas flagellata]
MADAKFPKATFKPDHPFLRTLALSFIVGWFALGGLGHFLFTNAFVAIVPDYVPFARFMVLFTGVCEIGGALCLVIRPEFRRPMGWALMTLTVCVTPANLGMALDANRYPAIGVLGLWLRLAFQPVLVWLIWWSTSAGGKTA